MSTTSIQWTATRLPDGTTKPGDTWNPVTGCTRASAGCDNCYAVKMSRRLHAMGQAKYQGLVNEGKNHFNGMVVCHPSDLVIPLRKRQPTTYFVNSMSDLFHHGVPFEFIDKVFAVMAMCPEHKFLVLTKRPERMVEYFAAGEAALFERWETAACDPTVGNSPCAAGIVAEASWPLANVGLGTSIEDQPSADKRIPSLLRVPAAMRFLSCEPLIGPVDLWGARYSLPNGGLGSAFNWGDGVNWVIVGGESGTGPNIRPMHQEWASCIRDHCQAAEVAFFFKQWGRWWPITQIPMAVYDSLHVPTSPRTAARTGFDQRCTVATTNINSVGLPYDMTALNAGRPLLLFNVGKHRSGRLLDGREHNDRPEAFFNSLQPN